MNAELLGYSGEVYFYSWARKHLDLPESKIAKTIRDFNILSAAASNSLAFLFLGIFILLGKAQLTNLIGNASPVYFLVIGLAFLILISLFIRFRRYIFATSLKVSAIVFSIYFLKLALSITIEMAMWEVTIPEISLETWLTYVAASILVSRIPLSNKKLIFVGVGVEMSTSMGIPEAPLFGLLATIVALEKGLSLLLFFLFSLSSDYREYETGMIVDRDPDHSLKARLLKPDKI